MKEELITYNTAKLAKEKGFDYPYIFPEQVGVLSCYSEIGDLGTSLMNNAIYNIQAPIQSLLQRWLREEHKINIIVFPMLNDGIDCYYNYDIYTNLADTYSECLTYINTYEEAMELGLIEALNLIEI